MKSYLHRAVPRRRAQFLHAPGWHGEGGRPRDEVLCFGIAWPDGGQATNLDGWGRQLPDLTEPAHGLEQRSGGGSDREHSMEYWAWPVPGPGLLRFVVEWPAFGISETDEVLDAALLVEAAGRARPVWPEDAGKASHLSRTMLRAAHHPGQPARASGPIVEI